MTTKEALKRLLDELTDDELRELETFAGYLKHRRRNQPRVGPGWPTALRELRDRIGAQAVMISDQPGEPWLVKYADQSPLVPLDPMLQALYSAPLDDEPLTAEEEAAIAEGRRDVEAGAVEPWEQVRRELGLE